MRKAALYARVSTDGQQKEGTIESQLAELRKQVAAAGHELVKEYIDNGYSGTLLDRPGLGQLRADAKSDVYDAIHFLDADRITRDVSYQRIIIAELLKRGKQTSRAFLVGAGLKPAPRAPRGQPALAARIARVSVRTGCVLSAAAFMSDTHYTLDV